MATLREKSHFRQKNQKIFTNFYPKSVNLLGEATSKPSDVVINSHHTLDFPPQYKGSNMFMPTGEQLFWQAEVLSPPHGPATCQDFEEIRSRCLSEGVLFEDPEFPAGDISLCWDEKKRKEFLTEYGPVEWRRPGDLVKNPKFYVEEFSRFDVKQLYLGDCWFDAAMATLTTEKKIFNLVVPSDQNFDKEYAGVFHFRFWQFGRWVDVVIDDLLPIVDGDLAFVHSSENDEFWSALLEKAYAKLYGSYLALDGGQEVDALEDLSGGLSETYEVSNLPENFFSHLLKAYARNSLLCAGISKNVNECSGLVQNHAYSITCVKQLDSETPLLRIRNPWGSKTEWTGTWSDKSAKWKHITEKKKKALGLTVQNDGEFWMSYKDFTKYFSSVSICSLNPEFLFPNEYSDDCKKIWMISMFEGKWVKGETAGGNDNNSESYWSNPQYIITVTDPDEHTLCTVIISLTQKFTRTRCGTNELAIGFNVYQIYDDQIDNHLDGKFFDENEPVNDSMEYIAARGLTAHMKLEPGRYVIVPSTFGPDEEGEFLLRVLTEKPHGMCKPRHRDHYN